MVVDKIGDLIGKRGGGDDRDERRYIMLMESFLDNLMIVDKVKELGWSIIVVKNQKQMFKAANIAAKLQTYATKDTKKLNKLH